MPSFDGQVAREMGERPIDKLPPMALVRYHESIALHRLFVLILIPIKVWECLGDVVNLSTSKLITVNAWMRHTLKTENSKFQIPFFAARLRSLPPSCRRRVPGHYCRQLRTRSHGFCRKRPASCKTSVAGATESHFHSEPIRAEELIDGIVVRLSKAYLSAHVCACLWLTTKLLFRLSVHFGDVLEMLKYYHKDSA